MTHPTVDTLIAAALWCVAIPAGAVLLAMAFAIVLAPPLATSAVPERARVVHHAPGWGRRPTAAAILAAIAMRAWMGRELLAIEAGPAAGETEGEPEQETEPEREGTQGPTPFNPLDDPPSDDDTQAYEGLVGEVEDYLREHAKEQA